MLIHNVDPLDVDPLDVDPLDVDPLDVVALAREWFTISCSRVASNDGSMRVT